MSKGFHGRILFVDLSARTSELRSFDDDFYRKYLGGGAFGAYFLLRERPDALDPMDERNLLSLAPSVTTGAAVSGVSRCSLSALSPLTGMVADSQAGGRIGPYLKRAGVDALLLSGRADSPVYLHVENGRAEIRDAAHLTGQPVTAVREALADELGGKRLCVVQCGPAGERKVRFACAMADGNDVFGRTGLGAVFGAKNLRAICVRGAGELDFADPELLGQLARKGAARVSEAGFPRTLRAHGTPGVVSAQASAGNLATRNYARSFHPDHARLDGSTYDAELGAGETTCYGCAVRCRKRVQADKPYPLTTELGGPEFETLGMLGSNLEILDPAAVARASQLCGEYGIDTITMGGLAGYVFECLEKGLIPEDAAEGERLRFGSPEGLFWLIERVGRREGIGDVLADGFTAAVAAFGEQTAPYAIHVKNQGLAVHMPQVKPSQALMYAACPIGPDHQSSEHDWLLASGGEDCKALGIIGRGDAASTGSPKVRMTVYGQHYYSLLDALCLCQFCWGPGNLFTYRDLEDLVSACTGWQVSFFELMKAGERRVNLQRQLNARRGFGRQHDVLPERVFEPLPDGPKAGQHVDRERFTEMLSAFYAMQGWDPDTGKPTAGKLLELGLDWSL
ncbi:MAG: aldehyde ferredoxin oxidoreductase family protein [Deltaproteobacteria bacterium]|nr:aldehyde ferredoxin oxidoreductase family protein [Deltaproteobacteria bacterium]